MHRHQRRSAIRVLQLEPRCLLSASPWTSGDVDYATWQSQTFSTQIVELSTVAGTQSQPPIASLDTPQATWAPSALDAQSGPLIGLNQVFASYSYRGAGYSVAVIDTGIDYTHANLGGGWGNRVIAGYDFVNDDYDPMDDNGHGTHVAGIIGSSHATYRGIAPDVNLVALKVLGADGTGSFGAVERALRWVAENQAAYNIVAVNLSLGAGNFTINPYAFLDDELSLLESQGVFIAAASGNSFYSYNSAQGLGYPAISSQTVSVGAVWDANVGAVSWQSGGRDYSTAADRITSFTQRSNLLDILAPGALITSTYLNGGFATLAGTSMATPIVAGAAALVHQALDAVERSALATQTYILDLMQSTGVTVVDGDDENDNVVNTGLSFKRLDLLAAIGAAVAPSAPSTTDPPTPPASNSNDLFAYGARFTGGVRVAIGDVNGDGKDEVITAAGSGGGPHVRVFDGATLSQIAGPLGSFYAYSSAFTGGVYVAAGDVNGDGFADIITGAGEGGGPHVRVFSGQDGRVLREFFAYGTTFRGGVHVAAGDVDGDGHADIITGAGIGGGPHVRVFSGATGAVIRSFFAFESTFTGGVFVAASDVDGDGRDNVIVSSGAGRTAAVRIYQNTGAATLANLTLAGAASNLGIHVAAGDVDGDGHADVILGAAHGSAPRVRAFSGADFSQLVSFDAYASNFQGGVFIAAGDLSGTGDVQIVTGAGATGGPHVRAWQAGFGQSQLGLAAGASISSELGLRSWAAQYDVTSGSPTGSPSSSSGNLDDGDILNSTTVGASEGADLSWTDFGGMNRHLQRRSAERWYTADQHAAPMSARIDAWMALLACADEIPTANDPVDAWIDLAFDGEATVP